MTKEESGRGARAPQDPPDDRPAHQPVEEALAQAQEALARKTHELAQAQALVRATLDCITDAILVTDAAQRVTDFNERFVSMWSLPRALLDAGDHHQVAQAIGQRSSDPAQFMARIAAIHAAAPTESYDRLELGDGRVFEQLSRAQRVDGKGVGRVWRFREITERDRVEEALRKQSEWLRVTLTSIGDAVITTDTRATITSLNPVAEELTGWTDKEARGLPLARVFAIVNEASREPVENPVVQVLRAGSIVGLADHTVLVTKDGTERPIDDSAAPIIDDRGEIVGVVLIFRDVTERRRAAETQRRLSAIVESSDDAILAKDLAGRVTTWNAGAERLYGFTAAEILGESFSVLVPPARAAEVEDGMRRLRLGQRLDHFETVRRRKDGSLIDVSVSYSPLPDAAGHIIGTSVITRDITRQKRAEEDLRASVERLNLAFAAARLGDWSWDAESDAVTLSDRAAEIFGIPPGHPLSWRRIQEELLHKDDRERARLQVEQSVTTHPQYDIEYRVNRPDGTQVWVAALGHAQYSPAGQPIGMIGVVQDITARKRVEEALREEASITETLHRIGRTLAAELELEKIVQTVTDASTALTGAQFGAFFYNVLSEGGEAYTLYTLSGVPRAAFAGFPMPRNTQIFEPTFRGRGVLRLDNVKKDPRYGKNLPHHGMPAGHLPVTSYLAVSVVSRSGEVLGGLFFGHAEAGVFTDRHERIVEGIASQAAVAIDNSRLYQAVRDADRKKDEFLAVLSHELRNPLAPIASALEIMKVAGTKGELAARARAMAERQVQALTRIVDDLLDVSRIIRGKIELRRERVELAAVVSRAVETARPLIDANRHTLQVLLGDAPVWVEVDVVRIAQVVSNLLNNAAKYTDPGGQLRLLVRAEEGRAVVRVQDNGIGIAAEKLGAVFDMFVQVAAVGLRSQGGLGIGLTVVRNLVEMHGGTVEARSAGLGRGSEFVVRLPLAKSLAERVADPGALGSQTAAPPGRRVLIVDDNVDSAVSLAMLLELEGHQVQVAHDGATALRLAAANPPEVALLDIGMPGMSGHELAARFRAHPLLQTVRLVAMTGWGQEEDRQKSKNAGFAHHLTKPVALAALRTILTLGAAS